MNYDRYFSRGQKVFLINMSATRDESVYESLTATVVSCDETRITLKSGYRIFSGEATMFEPGMMFKLTTESFGVGVQLCAELISTPGAETIIVSPASGMEIYQRRSVGRVDTTIPFLHVPQKSSLSAFQREWKRVVGDLRRPSPPRLRMKDAMVNISAGGIRFDIDGQPTQLSIIVADLQDGLAPVCAVAELVWQKPRQDSELLACGHRFLEILKEDQLRLVNFVEKKGGNSGGRFKDNWDLNDKMMSRPDQNR